MKTTTALITGASSGIGRSFARALAKEGHNLIITGRRRERLESIADELSQSCSVSIQVEAFDLSDSEALETFALSVEAASEVGILINNAGFGAGKPFSEDSYANQARMLKVHIDASTRLAHAVLPGMKRRSTGAVINVASLAGFVPNPADALYSATKAYLVRFSESLQLELSGTGIRIQALCPGFIRTEFHERLGKGAGFNQWNRGIFQWMEADEIIADSLKALESCRPKVIVVPGRFYRFLYFLNRLLPRRVTYAQSLKRYRSREG